jgi:hypothetical protein
MDTKNVNGRGIGKKARQTKFIQGIRETGTVLNGLRKSEVDRSTYKRWMAEDPEFPELLADARAEFGEALEEVVIGIVMDPEAVKRSPILAITLLNANLPFKYRPTAIVQEDTARDLLKEFRKAAKKSPPAGEPVEDTPIDKQIEEILSEKYQDGGS